MNIERHEYLKQFRTDIYGKAIVVGYKGDLDKLRDDIPEVCKELLEVRSAFKKVQHRCGVSTGERKKEHAMNMSLLCKQAIQIAKDNGFFLDIGKFFGFKGNGVTQYIPEELK